MADLIIGSGPAGVAAAAALLARGRQVIMVDAGETLEPDREALRGRLAASEPAGWSAEDLEAYHAPAKAQPGAVLRYGSDFLFQDREGLFDGGRPNWLGLRPSYAKGGLSNGWGAAVLPYRQEDMTDWPISADDLAPHYRAVAEFLPIAGEPDDLAAFFPAQDVSGLTPAPPTGQARTLLARMAAKRTALARDGVVFGRARQGVAAKDCRLCGLCLHGCPYELIFKAGAVVETLKGRPGFTYRPGLKALEFAEDAEGVRLTCRPIGGGGTEVLTGERLFIAAGVLPSAQLMLASIGAPGGEAVLLDSQHLFLPMLHLWSSPTDPTKEPRHALTQAFVELTDPAVSPFTVHAQLYTFNEVYAQDMKANYAQRAPFLGPAFDLLGRRLIVAQMFLHSDHSHRIAVRLGADRQKLEARLIVNPEMEAVARRARAKFASALLRAGLVGLTPASRLAEPGSSFHVGGSFPMRAAPTGRESDVLGRPAGLRRVHLVDASVLPAIPATTITYSVMANAHRIAATA
jgi:choline dehydrogenase-like flavoprotein